MGYIDIKPVGKNNFSEKYLNLNCLVNTYILRSSNLYIQSPSSIEFAKYTCVFFNETPVSIINIPTNLYIQKEKKITFYLIKKVNFVFQAYVK